MATITSPTVKDVLDQELEQVKTSRNLRLGNSLWPAAPDSLIGLAFSGGGIRSATFNLGILQALARERLLRAFDYVSTVSGGGYIGGWLMAWMHHQKIGIRELEYKLAPESKAPNEPADPPEVHYLRNYSNYLTPRKGALSTDFWAFIAGYVRNTLLNLTILVLAFLSLLLMPRSLAYLVNLAFQKVPDRAVLLGAVFALVAVGFIGFNLVSIYQERGENRKPPQDHAKANGLGSWLRGSSGIQIVIVLPLLLSAACFAYGMEQFPTKHWLEAPMAGCILYFLLWAFSLTTERIVRLFEEKANQSDVKYEHPSDRDRKCGSCRHFIRRGPPLCTTVEGPNSEEDWCERFGTKDEIPSVRLILVTAVITSFITGFLFIPFQHLLDPKGSPLDSWRTMTLGTPFIVGMMLITGTLHIGVMGRGMIDKHREWWGRLGALLVIYAASWLVLFLIAVYFPSYLKHFLDSRKVTITGLTVSGLVWAASTAYGVFFGKSSLSGLSTLNATNRQKIWHYLARVTPYIFILGAFLGLSLLVSAFCAWSTGHGWSLLGEQYFGEWIFLACVSFLGASVILSWRVDINEFSIHYLYRNRLIRCYLGACRPGRHAQPFTGFSDLDNFPLSELQIPRAPGKPEDADARPLPIMNTSLNVVRGKELALQSRKARSFAFTPLYGGFTRRLPDVRNWDSCFGPTEEAGCQRPAYPKGITLGTCIAVSGAAASPNMGSHSEPGLAFLMTLFDVRLGCWIGNPGHVGRAFDPRRGWWAGDPTRKWWRRGSPGIGLVRLLCELMGNTNDDSNFLYLSDGGHFENLGIYELVRRRCKVIVACDASCDESCTLADLHNAMERCRTDFGVTITLDDDALLKPTGPQDALRSKRHFVTGTIHYPGSSPVEGKIIYIKPTLVDGDPEDVLAYNKVNPHFPHDTTADQWFDEAHFENYRALGEAAGESATKLIKEAIKHSIGYDPRTWGVAA